MWVGLIESVEDVKSKGPRFPKEALLPLDCNTETLPEFPAFRLKTARSTLPWVSSLSCRFNN